MNVVDVYGEAVDDLEGLDRGVGGPAFDVESAVGVAAGTAFVFAVDADLVAVADRHAFVVK